MHLKDKSSFDWHGSFMRGGKGMGGIDRTLSAALGVGGPVEYEWRKFPIKVFFQIPSLLSDDGICSMLISLAQLMF